MLTGGEGFGGNLDFDKNISVISEYRGGYGTATGAITKKSVKDTVLVGGDGTSAGGVELGAGGDSVKKFGLLASLAIDHPETG